MTPTKPSESAAACQAALLTPRGRGAVATIAVTGAAGAATVARWFRCASGRPLADAPLRTIVLGRWEPTGEELVACRLDENRLEIHCHGGSAAVESILETLAGAGCRRTDWRQWAAQFVTDRLAAAALAALAEAPTQRTAAILLDQYRGALRAELMQIVADLRAERIDRARQRLEILHERGRIGLRLTAPWRVVLAGAPNVGKSSLINAIVGYQRSIVVDRPGATRDVVTAQTAIDGWPVELADTAGLCITADEVEAAGVEKAQAAVQQADLVILVSDAAHSSASDFVAQLAGRPNVLHVVNKCDLAAPDNSLLQSGMPTSALRGDGIAALIAAISAKLAPAAPPAGAAVPFTMAQLATIRRSLEAVETNASSAAAVLAELLS